MELCSAVFRMTKCHTCGSGSKCKEGYICIHEFFLLGGGGSHNQPAGAILYDHDVNLLFMFF